MFPCGPVPAYCTVLSVYLAVLLLRLWHCYCWNAGLKDQRHYRVKTKKKGFSHSDLLRRRAVVAVPVQVLQVDARHRLHAHHQALGHRRYGL